jgi:HK97 gp10 family phage protein
MPKGYYWSRPFQGKEINMRAWVGLSLALEAFAVNVWSYARLVVPKDTWSLRNSIRIERYEGATKAWVRYQILAGSGDIGNSGFRSIARGGGGVGVGYTRATKGRTWRDPYYALYVELGTRRMAAKPYMRPAFNKYKYKLKATARKIMNRSFRGPGSSGG